MAESTRTNAFCILIARREIECWQVVLRDGSLSIDERDRLELEDKAAAADCKALLRSQDGSVRDDAKTYAAKLSDAPIETWLSSMNDSALAYLAWEARYA